MGRTLGGGALAALVALSAAIAAAAAMQCAQRREISPCSCQRDDNNKLQLKCERLESYARIFETLRTRFPEGTTAELAISHSDLQDLAQPPLSMLGLTLTTLKLNYNNISELDDTAFVGLGSIGYLDLADNELSTVPRHVLHHMPGIKTMDLGWSKIKTLARDDLKELPSLAYLILAGNGLECLEKDSLPRELKHLHVGRNQLTSLNGTVRNLDNLEWLLINQNMLTTIESEIPRNARKMKWFKAEHNRLESLPWEIRNMPILETVELSYNNIKSLDGVFAVSRRLDRLNLSHNKIKHLAHDDFLETVNLTNLDLGCNVIVSLNGSFRNMSLLKFLNLTQNQLGEFSLLEIRGLKRLQFVDLSHNKITHLSGNTENMIDLGTVLLELKLSYNKLRNLGGALMGLHGLQRLNISHNLFETISPDDLIGLDQLRVIDVSHNHIITIEETSKTFLPALEELHASFNKITALEKDFHGLPGLCHADLSHNNVESINIELVSKTRCSIHGVKGILKVHLHGNPVVCDENFPELNKYEETLHARFNGECAHRKTFTPTVVATSLLNDIMPINGELFLSSNVVSLDGQTDKRSKITGGKLLHVLKGGDQGMVQQLYHSTTPQPYQNRWQEYQYRTRPSPNR